MPYELPHSWTLSALADKVDVKLDTPVDFNISSVAPLGDTEKGSLTFYSGSPANAKEALADVAPGCAVCISSESRQVVSRQDIGFFVDASPRFAFICLVDHIMSESNSADAGISPLAAVDESAVIGSKVSIGPFVTIGPNAHVGDRCVIDAGAFIDGRVVLENDVLVGPNSTLGVGGQASEKDSIGRHVGLHHFARVVVGAGTRIGANSVVVRGSLQDTIIGKRCTIGHRVSIGHNCRVGDDCFISANATLAGSVSLGNDVWVGPGSTVLNKTKVGAEAIVGLGSVVTKNVDVGKFVVGNPAREIRQSDPTRYNRKNA